jgi:hypothetical protein
MSSAPTAKAVVESKLKLFCMRQDNGVQRLAGRRVSEIDRRERWLERVPQPIDNDDAMAMTASRTGILRRLPPA